MHYRFVLSGLLKVWQANAFFVVFEEQLIRFLNSLADILYGLRTHLQPPGVPFPKLGDVFLQSGTVQVLAPHSVVPFVEGNTMVVDTPCGIDCPLEVSIPLMLVELELERFHGCYDTSVSRLNKFSPSLISPVWKTGALRFTFVRLERMGERSQPCKRVKSNWQTTFAVDRHPATGVTLNKSATKTKMPGY